MLSTPRRHEQLRTAHGRRPTSLTFGGYTAQEWSVDQADRYYRGIITALQMLGEQPSLGRTCDDIRPGYRRYNVAAHVVFYILTDGVVDVVRILHARRDFQRHLPNA